MTYNLNLIPGKVPVAVHVKQYDTGLREITFNLYYGDTEYSVPYNSTIAVSGTKPDGNGFSYNVTQFSGSAVTVPMQEQMTVLAGEFPCQLTIANSGEIIGTASFLLCVEPAALSSDTPVSDTDLAMFQQLANQTQTEAAGVANATAQIAANTQNIATNTAAITELNGKTVLSLTRAEQSWVNETDFARLYAMKRGNMLHLRGNLCVTYGSGFSGEFQQIGTINGWNAASEVYINVPMQNDGSKVVAVQILTSGVIKIYSSTAFSGNPFFRFNVCVPCA